MLLRLQKGLRTDLGRAWSYFRLHGIRETLAWLKSREAPVTFQFLKYAVLGVFTTLIQLGLFTWLSHTWFPAHDYLVDGGIPDLIKEKNAVFSNLLAFPVAAIFNYAANLIFVFTPGRHSRRREFGLFMGISFATFAAGLLSGPLLISRGLDPWIAQAALVFTSALLNFVCRKFIVFLR
ncbi:MAG: GtrA family protein [Verrucomicrobiae bacterium]|nr:GtrA family protein [Verrucomicrobiae bacterium]